MSWLAGFFRWLSDFFWPGDWAKDAAKKEFTAYTISKDAAKLKAAIQNFELAVEQYRKHQNPSLAATLYNYAVAVWRHYEDFDRSPDDLDKVIRLDTEARKSWSGEKNTKTYLLLLNALAGAYFEQYQRAFEPSPIKPDGKQRAFDKAVKYYTELKDNPAAGSQRSTTLIQLGIIFRIRSEFEQTLDRFEIGVQHLQDALSDANKAAKAIDAGDDEDKEAKQDKKAAVDDIKVTCLLNLADSYQVRYALVKDPRKVHDLTMAIDSNTNAKSLLEDLHHPELPACLFNLARQLWLRWLQTKDQSDHDTAKEMAEAARDKVDDDEPLKQNIDQLLNVLLEPESRQGTIDSVDMHTLGAPSRRGTIYEAFDNIQIPKRRGTVISIDDIPQPLE